MNLELNRGQVSLGVDTPSVAEEARVSNQAKEFDGGGPDEVSMADVEGAIDELNKARADGKLEFFEKDGVVHVRPTEKQLLQVRG